MFAIFLSLGAATSIAEIRRSVNETTAGAWAIAVAKESVFNITTIERHALGFACFLTLLPTWAGINAFAGSYGRDGWCWVVAAFGVSIYFTGAIVGMIVHVARSQKKRPYIVIEFENDAELERIGPIVAGAVAGAGKPHEN